MSFLNTQAKMSMKSSYIDNRMERMLAALALHVADDTFGMHDARDWDSNLVNALQNSH